MMPPDAGISRLERIFLTILFLVLTYALLFFAVSRLGLIHGRHLLVFAAAGPIAWCFLHWVLAPQTLPTRQDAQTISAILLIMGIVGVALFVITAPGYVLVNHDPIIVPTLADALISHSTTMDVYRPGDVGFTYPPGYPILFSVISRVLRHCHRCSPSRWERPFWCCCFRSAGLGWPTASFACPCQSG